MQARIVTSALCFACSCEPQSDDVPTDDVAHTDPPPVDTETDSLADTDTPVDTGSTGDTGRPPLVPGACGELVSGFSFGGTGFDTNSELGLAPDGSLYVAALFDAPIVLDPGGTAETTLVPAGYQDVLLAKYDASGALSWAIAIHSTESVTSEVLRAFDEGVVLSGTFYETVTFDGAATSLTSVGMNDTWLARFDDTGALVWARSAGGVDGDFGLDHVVLSDQTIVAGGLYRADATFGAGEPNDTTLALDDDAFEAGWLGRYDADGNLMWVQSIAGTQFARVTSIAADESDLLSVAGSYSGPGVATFGPGQTGAIDLDPDGAEGYLGHWLADGTIIGVVHQTAFPEKVDVTADGAAVLTGEFQGTATFGAGEINETTLSSTGNPNAWVARFESDLSFGWAVQTESVQDGIELGYGIVATADGGAVAIGYFTDATIFGAGTATETMLDSSGPFNYDPFAARYDVAGALVCALSIPGAGIDLGDDIIAADDGTYWFSGTFGGAPIRLDAGGPNEIELTSEGSLDVFVGNYWF